MKKNEWGARGSIPSPCPDTIRFGGNTSCITVDYDDFFIIFDAGSGIRLFGDWLLSNKKIRYPFIEVFAWVRCDKLPSSDSDTLGDITRFGNANKPRNWFPISCNYDLTFPPRFDFIDELG